MQAPVVRVPELLLLNLISPLISSVVPIKERGHHARAISRTMASTYSLFSVCPFRQRRHILYNIRNQLPESLRVLRDGEWLSYLCPGHLSTLSGHIHVFFKCFRLFYFEISAIDALPAPSKPIPNLSYYPEDFLFSSLSVFILSGAHSSSCFYIIAHANNDYMIDEMSDVVIQ